MKFDKTTRRAIQCCIEHHIPFACYAMPGSDSAEFFADFPPQADSASCEIEASAIDGFDGFLIGMFELDDEVRPIGIRRRFDAADVLKFGNAVNFFESPTYVSLNASDLNHYKAQVHNIVKDLKPGEKTVLSRVECIQSAVRPVDAAESYFTKHPTCFRSLYYTYDTGLWLGATPELLVNYDFQSRSASTMSIAGTRPIDMVGEPWDEKNIEEHDIVTRFIIDVFRKYSEGREPKVEAMVTTFGPVEHLSHRVEATLDCSLAELLPQLNPTPAVCGWPREKAYDHIVRYEPHQRNCYGGFVGVTRPGESARLFVNLRCAVVSYDPDISLYNLFGGGGITKRSNADEEFYETELKMNSLTDILLSF